MLRMLAVFAEHEREQIRSAPKLWRPQLDALRQANASTARAGSPRRGISRREVWAREPKG